MLSTSCGTSLLNENTINFSSTEPKEGLSSDATPATKEPSPVVVTEPSKPAVTTEEVEKEETKVEISLIGDNTTGRYYSDKTYEKNCYAYNNSENYRGEVGDGVYLLQTNKDQTPIKAYCDMTRDGGGWTLLVSNVTSTPWDTNTIKSLNNTTPSPDINYSILGLGDQLKTLVGGKLKYRLEAVQAGSNGGIWEAPGEYSFVKTDATQVDVNIIKKFKSHDPNVNEEWEYENPAENNPGNIEKRMPWITGGTAILTTSSDPDSMYYGSVAQSVANEYSPAPWIRYIANDPNASGLGGSEGTVAAKVWYWTQ